MPHLVARVVHFLLAVFVALTAIYGAFFVIPSLPGYVLAAIVVVKGAAMGAGIAAMLIVEAAVTGELQTPPIVLFLLVSAVSLVLGIRVYGSIDASPAVVASLTTGPMSHGTVPG